MLSTEEFNSTLRQLKYEDGVELCLYQLENELRQNIGPSFRRSTEKISDLIRNNITGCSRQSMDIFIHSVTDLHKEIEKYWKWAGSRDGDGKFRMKTVALTKAIVFHTLWPELRETVRFVYEKTFSVFYQSQNRGKVPLTSPEDGSCGICEKMKTKCECWYLVTQFRANNERLLDLQLLDRIAGVTVTEIARSTIEDRVKETCGSLFDLEHLDSLKEWLETSLLKWLEEVYVFSAQSTKPAASTRRSKPFDVSVVSEPKMEGNEPDENNADFDINRTGQFEKQKRRLSHFLHDAYGGYLIDRLFDIIVDYPESKPALLDLKRCLAWSNSLRARLTEGLKSSLERRLLHPGVNTADILSAYIQTVYSLRLVDSSGVLMENVCQPLRQYLRQRTDTVRCIVSYLTDSGGLEINSTFVPGAADASLSFNESSAALGDGGAGAPVANANADDDWIQWQPDPVDAAPETIGRARRSADVISMLVGVYGSREQFVKEYCQLLAERLLRATTYDIDDELRYLELLKLRIGEAELNQCEVMLKDVRDSQRINSFVNSQSTMSEFSFNLSALVYSSYFWPTVKEERLQLPPSITAALEAYGKCFEMQKASRSLDWKTQLGTVELELELGGRVLSVHVSPILATIITLFEQKDTWTAEALASELKIPLGILRRRIAWWTGLEVIREVNAGVYQLCNELPSASLSKRRRFSYCVGEDDDDESTRDSGDLVDKVEQLETYWPYIMGLLTSFEELPAERIHTLLRMFCSQGQEPSLETVHSFLQRKVRDQQLLYVSGSYKLQRK